MTARTAEIRVATCLAQIIEPKTMTEINATELSHKPIGVTLCMKVVKGRLKRAATKAIPK
jgi:hypothetical protein